MILALVGFCLGVLVGGAWAARTYRRIYTAHAQIIAQALLASAEAVGVAQDLSVEAPRASHVAQAAQAEGPIAIVRMTGRMH